MYRRMLKIASGLTDRICVLIWPLLLYNNTELLHPKWKDPAHCQVQEPLCILLKVDIKCYWTDHLQSHPATLECVGLGF